MIVPLALLAGGYWRALAGGAAAVATLGAATLVAFGPGIWSAFYASLEPTRVIVIENGGTGWYKIQSAFSYTRMSGGSVAQAYAVQGVVTAAVLGATAWLWRSRAPFELRAASLMIGALLATPYVLDYDMVLLGPALCFLVRDGLAHGFRRWEKTALAFAWIVPVATRQLAFFGHVPGGLLAMSILFILTVGRAMEPAREMREAALAAA